MFDFQAEETESRKHDAVNYSQELLGLPLIQRFSAGSLAGLEGKILKFKREQILLSSEKIFTPC